MLSRYCRVLSKYAKVLTRLIHQSALSFFSVHVNLLKIQKMREFIAILNVTKKTSEINIVWIELQTHRVIF